MPRMVSLRKRFAELIPELAKFGVVGLIGSVIDLGGAAYLHGALGIGPMVSKGLSIIAATVLTYLGSRFWTFRHRVNQALLREGVLFAALNIVGLAIAECVIAFVTYGLDLKGTLAYNAASLAGTGLGAQPGHQFQRGRRYVRLRPRREHLDQPAGLLAAGAGQPARAAQLHAARHLVHAGREQRAGQGVPGEAGVRPAGEPERHRGTAVDQCTEAGVAAHRAAAGPAGSGRSGARIALVAVSRTTVNQRRQPAAWYQRSCSGPFGLARTNRYAAHRWSSSVDGRAGYGTPACAP